MSEPEQRRPSARVLAAGFIGNVLEWYDFAVYGFLAQTIGDLFFPTGDRTTSLIASFGAFAAGFLMRPLGAILFGYVGDLVGRKVALTLSILLMAIPTFLIGLLPTHAEIGFAAAALLVLLRMLQGVSVGGEYIGSVVFLTELAPRGRRALYASFGVLGAVGGILSGSAVGALLTSWTTPEQLAAGGWRIPFLAGILIAVVGLWVRRGVEEPHGSGEKSKSPFVDAARTHPKQVLQATLLNLMTAVSFYTVFVYMATWLQDEVGEPAATALTINTVCMAVFGAASPVTALLADRFGRKPFLLIGSFGMATLAYPLLWLMHHPSVPLILAGQLGFAVILGCYINVIPVTMTELFARPIRVSAASISYNLPLAVFGGTAPMVATWLVAATRDPLSVSWYLIAAAVVAFVVALTLPETKHHEMDR